MYEIRTKEQNKLFQLVIYNKKFKRSPDEIISSEYTTIARKPLVYCIENQIYYPLPRKKKPQFTTRALAKRYPRNSRAQHSRLLPHSPLRPPARLQRRASVDSGKPGRVNMASGPRAERNGNGRAVGTRAHTCASGTPYKRIPVRAGVRKLRRFVRRSLSSRGGGVDNRIFSPGGRFFRGCCAGSVSRGRNGFAWVVAERSGGN